MTRLYQWLQERAMAHRAESREPRRTVQTIVTVEEQQRMVLVTSGGPVGMDTCPLCGHDLDAAGSFVQGSLAITHGSCPGFRTEEQTIDVKKELP